MGGSEPLGIDVDSVQPTVQHFDSPTARRVFLPEELHIPNELFFNLPIAFSLTI